MTSAVGMPCPICRVPLVMSERQGVEIDYCPQCRGVWLDRGELDKIIQRSAQDAPPAAPAQPSGFLNPQHHPGHNPQHHQGHNPQHHQGHNPQHHPGHNPGYSQPYGHGQQYGHHKRKKSFIEELFD